MRWSSIHLLAEISYGSVTATSFCLLLPYKTVFSIDSFHTVVKYLYTQQKPFFSFKAYFTLISPTKDLLLDVKVGGYVGGAILGVANE